MVVVSVLHFLGKQYRLNWPLCELASREGDGNSVSLGFSEMQRAQLA